MRLSFLIAATTFVAAFSCVRPRPVVSVPAESGEQHLSNLRQLTNGGENAEAYFSSDGEWITFQSTRDGRTCDQQFVMRSDGSGVVRVSNGLGKTTCGWFFPGGERLFFASSHKRVATSNKKCRDASSSSPDSAATDKLAIDARESNRESRHSKNVSSSDPISSSSRCLRKALSTAHSC